MKNIFKRAICLLLITTLILSLITVLNSCKRDKSGKGEYTYNTWSTSLGTNWNPHAWETNADGAVLDYITSPFVSIEPLDTERGTYQWVYEMATSITDVTASHTSDLTKYRVTLPKDTPASAVKEGYVFEIKLNPEARWENGEKITADDYVYSMQQLLSSSMRNYRANLYISGESAVAGALAYYNSEAPIYKQWASLGESGVKGGITDTAVNSDGYITVLIDGKWQVVYSSTTLSNALFGSGWDTVYTDYGYGAKGYFDKEYTEDVSNPDALPYYVISREVAVDKNGDGEADLDSEGNPITEVKYFENLFLKYNGEEDAYGVFPVTPEALSDLKALASNFAALGSSDAAGWNLFAFYFTGYGDKVEYDRVGLYKVDDYTINYVCQTPIELNYFLTSSTDTWLVYKELYEAGKREEAGLTVTNYGTSKETTMSYGVYRLEAYEDAKQMVLTRNENWYGFKRGEGDELYSMTPFLVDGESLLQYQTTRVVIDVMDEATAKQKFFKGELIEYYPSADELASYVTSDRLYRVEETYTMSFFFNTNLSRLQALDKAGNNKNSVVLSNDKFRKAMSLAINRNDYVTVTQAWTPAYALMNGLYYYDIYNNPDSSYRASEEAMQAICNLYGVEWGEGKTYKTLKEAYSSINGYNLNEARALMREACDELVSSGLYKRGEEINVQIAWAKGSLTSDDNAQLTKLNQYINAALSGTGFGRITFSAVGNLDDRYGDVPAGRYAIGYGAWGGAAFYPFRNFQTYMDPDKYGVNELGSWDPRTEKLTLTVKGKAVTMTWQDWSNSMIGTGAFAGEDFETKLKITALLEERYLALYYRIPIASTTTCSLLSYKVNEYTDKYNIMYGFGGFRLLSYDFDDFEWREYVRGEGGTVSY